MQRVLDVVAIAQANLRNMLVDLGGQGGFSLVAYVRYLSFQFHLTKGVQKHFMMAASHPRMAGKRSLREFLFRFALEEEPHFKMAERDIRALGQSVLPCPIDVALWWSYFDELVKDRPFVRLGTTCVLENLGPGAGEAAKKVLSDSNFLNRSNTKFLDLHRHEALPHGDQIITALSNVNLAEEELFDLVEGANTGSILYLRMAKWALGMDPLLEVFSPYVRRDATKTEFDLDWSVVDAAYQ